MTDIHIYIHIQMQTDYTARLAKALGNHRAWSLADMYEYMMEEIDNVKVCKLMLPPQHKLSIVCPC